VTHSPTELRGIIPPLVTPLAADGAPDLDALARHAAGLLDAGVHGLWVNGTTGEFHGQTPAARAATVRAVAAAAAGRVPVVAQVGDASTELAIAHAQAAAAAGADFVAAIPPFYVEASQAELVAYYRALAEASPLPLLVFQLPRLAKVGLTVENLIALAGEGAVVGIKDSADDLAFYRRLLHQAAAAGVALRCFVGGGALVDLSLLAGGHGAMCAVANVAPRRCVAIYEAAAAGDWAAAATHQAILQDLIEALRLPGRSGATGTTAALKGVLRETGAIPNDDLAPPAAPLDQSERRLLAERALPWLARWETRETSAMGANAA
jgi:4-hydroxy-tetrahydrodipicolinate synthase